MNWKFWRSGDKQSKMIGCNEVCLDCHVGLHDMCKRPSLCQCDGKREEREVTG